jgi:uncharacterized damage-inducible protein DinB
LISAFVFAIAVADPTAAAVNQTFAMISRNFVSLADAMPDDKWTFAPKDGRDGAFNGARTFAQQVKHVACANVAFGSEIEHKAPPAGCETGGPHTATSKAELMKYLRESFEYASSVLNTLTSGDALDPTEGPYAGKSTRLGVATLAVWHASDHYGQLVVYLRMNGIVPPASR